MKMTEKGTKAEVNVAACKGCGACASVCPQKAITMSHYSDGMIIQEVLACLTQEVSE